MKHDDAVDPDVLLHPARAFAHPRDVLTQDDLTINEKRAILASWASDACAVEAAPALRNSVDGNFVAFDDIMDALRELDAQVHQQGAPKPAPGQRWTVGHRLMRGPHRQGGGGTPPLPLAG